MGHIWLIGMMGSGKTTVGILASQMLDLPFVDTDETVMTTTGKTIPELFQDGEEAFRMAETSAIADVASGDDSIIAAGGGAILSQDNVTMMRGTGSVILLSVDASTVVERVEIGSSRPLLPTEESVERILTERAEVYRTVANHAVDTVGRTPQEIAMEVASCVGM
jgi:shikimate kinase